jgi:hypothetical protein
VAAAASPSVAAAPSTNTASCAKAISWKYAGRYVGRVVAIKGRVVDAFYSADSKGRPTFLNFRRPYKGAFTAVIWGESRGLFGGFPEDLFLGRNVCVTGKVTWYQGPQMVLRRQSQITILR